MNGTDNFKKEIDSALYKNVYQNNVGDISLIQNGRIYKDDNINETNKSNSHSKVMNISSREKFGDLLPNDSVNSYSKTESVMERIGPNSKNGSVEMQHVKPVIQSTLPNNNIPSFSTNNFQAQQVIPSSNLTSISNSSLINSTHNSASQYFGPGIMKQSTNNQMKPPSSLAASPHGFKVTDASKMSSNLHLQFTAPEPSSAVVSTLENRRNFPGASATIQAPSTFPVSSHGIAASFDSSKMSQIPPSSLSSSSRSIKSPVAQLMRSSPIITPSPSPIKPQSSIGPPFRVITPSPTLIRPSPSITGASPRSFANNSMSSGVSSLCDAPKPIGSSTPFVKPNAQSSLGMFNASTIVQAPPKPVFQVPPVSFQAPPTSLQATSTSFKVPPMPPTLFRASPATLQAPAKLFQSSTTYNASPATFQAPPQSYNAPQITSQAPPAIFPNSTSVQAPPLMFQGPPLVSQSSSTSFKALPTSSAPLPSPASFQSSPSQAPLSYSNFPTQFQESNKVLTTQPSDLNAFSNPISAPPPLSSRMASAPPIMTPPVSMNLNANLHQPVLPPFGGNTGSIIRPPTVTGAAESSLQGSYQPEQFQAGLSQQTSYPQSFNLPPGVKGHSVASKNINTFNGAYSGVDQISQQLGGFSVTKNSWNKGWGTAPIDLLQQKSIVPPDGLEIPTPVLAQEFLPQCSPDIFRSTLTKIPENQSVLQKARLPFGILIHPFKDLEHLAVVSCTTIVRCRSCRTYINPYVIFKGDKRWECNLCFRVNELPDEFQFDPVSRTYGDPSRRPEVREATLEFIAPQEYMLRPPQPATYIWVLDVSRQAIETGYLKIVCDTLLTYLDKIPGDRRTMIGFITFSTTIQFYYIGEDKKDMHMLDVGEIDEIFIPSPDGLLVHLDECKPLIAHFLSTLPDVHENTHCTQTALGAAVKAAYKLMSPIGGRITVMAVTLPTIGPGALSPREDPNQRAAKEITNVGPATDFYKKIALECSGQQIAVDLFTLNSQYIDLATLSGMSKFSGGCIYHFPAFNSANPSQVESFTSSLTRYITRKIGFEAVMRIRATRGLAITNFYGNFFVRSTDLLSLPNINPDSGFGMTVAIEEPLQNLRTACFQAALLYTSSRGERRIRVHTMCLPVCPNVADIVCSSDQQATISLLAKMGVERCLTSKMSDAREALINACTDALTAYKLTLAGGGAINMNGLLSPNTLRMMPLYTLALMKSVSFRHGLSTKLDDRLFAMCEMKTLPIKRLMQVLYPDMYAIHNLSEKGAINIEDVVIPQPGRLHLSSEYLDRAGAYLLDADCEIFIYIRCGICPNWVKDVIGVPGFSAIPQPFVNTSLPVLENVTSELIRNFITYIQRSKPYVVPISLVKDDNPLRRNFLQHLVDDRAEGAHSYIEFLQYVKSQVK